MAPTDWNLSLLLLGLVAVVYWWRAWRAGLVPPMDRWLRWPALLLPCYVVWQLLPLPLSFLRIVSPARAQLLDAVGNLMPPVSWAPLSIVPSTTGVHFLRIAGYTLLFLVIRDLAWRWWPPWRTAFPILIVGGFEAVLGLAQYAAGAEQAHGTYVNRNHFAGLLEMALPFAVMYGITLVRRSGSGGLSSALSMIKVGAALGVAAALFAGIVCSFSR
ncbi:MAG: hypothetical protein HY236_10215, partial [Acidobacteria bacterium]|nr:hypothetical protein [Acidobacteriota bacterium]